MQRTILSICLAAGLCLVFQPNISLAQESEVAEESAEAAAELDSGNIAWMLTSSALVLMMTAPGLALFYGGLVRKKNILGVMMQCFFLMGLMSVVWALWGYSLAFGGSNKFFGNLEYLFLNGVIPHWSDGAVVVPQTDGLPDSIFMIFQGMFFIITPAH